MAAVRSGKLGGWNENVSTFRDVTETFSYKPAGVAELVDALDSKSSFGNKVRVRFPPPAPSKLIAPLQGGTASLTQSSMLMPSISSSSEPSFRSAHSGVLR